MFKLVFSLIISGCSLALAAAPPSIGTVKSTGEFRVNGAAVPGNSTLFEGDIIETTAVRSAVQIGATQFTLLPDSRAYIFHDRTVLEKGSGLLAGAQSHTIEAATLRITPATEDSVIQVEISMPDRIAVAARDGVAEVRNASGALVATVQSGMALAFDSPPIGVSSTLKITGVLASGNGKFFLTDTTTNVKFELQGTDLAKYVDKQVEITGSTIPGVTAAGGASQVAHVVTIKTEGKKKLEGAAVAGGHSHVATIAIVSGVAVTGTVVGVASAGTFHHHHHKHLSHE